MTEAIELHGAQQDQLAVESEPFVSIGHGTMILNAREEGFTYIYKTWLDDKNPETEESKQKARCGAAESFDLLAGEIVNSPDFTKDEKKQQLRTIYGELIDLRRERFEEYFPDVDSDVLFLHYAMPSKLGIYLTNPPDEALETIKAHYRLELDKTLDLIEAISEGTLPISKRSINDYLLKKRKTYELTSTETFLGGAAIALFGLGIGRIVKSKLKKQTAA